MNTDFSPKTNGFKFENRFEFSLPVKFQIPYAGNVDLSKIVYGLCGGMCFSALDYFYAGITVPEVEQVDKIDFKLLVYLCDRQLDSLGLPTLLKLIQWMVWEDKELGTRMIRYELPKLRRSLDKGKPVVMALIRVKGLSDPTQNHQVLASGYQYEPDAQHMQIALYDPNYPGEEQWLKLDWDEPVQGIQITHSNGDKIRGFFLMDYKPQTMVPLLARSLQFFDVGLADSQPTFSLRWPVDSHRVNQYFGENPATYKPFGLPGHEGIDLYATTNANIYACADGEVYQVSQPKDHPYGLQIRIKHVRGNTVYRTVYAHLADTFVTNGQNVSAGELIGLANNTGNSFGSHLHLTLKIDGVQTPGYPADIVDPWPYLQSPISPPVPVSPPSPPSGITVFTTTELNMRTQPNLSSQVRSILPAGEGLSVLGDADNVREKIGEEGQWLEVQTASGLVGFVAAWFVQTIEDSLPPSDLVVYPNDLLNIRSGPSTIYDILSTVSSTDPLTVLGDANNGRSKIGKQGQWLQVQTSTGLRGYVAAWMVHTTGQTAPQTDLTVLSTTMLNVRARPSIDSNILTVVKPNDKLIVLGDKTLAQTRIGQMDQWLNVRTPEGYSGFVAAWLVTGSQQPIPAPDLIVMAVFASADINVRAQASINSPRVGGAFRNEKLQVIEADLNLAKDKIGKQDEWMHVELKDGTRGWAAAWLLRVSPT